MSLALPGSVDTGVTKSVAVSANCDFRDSHFWRAVGATGPVPSGSLGGRDQITFNDWIVYSNPWGGICGPLPPVPPGHPGYVGHYELWSHNTTAGIADVLIHSAGFPCQNQFPGGSQPTDTFTVPFAETTGPYRLGVGISLFAGGPYYPEFWSEFYVTYRWFADENTLKNTSVGAASATQYAGPVPGPVWTNSANPGMTPRAAGEIGGISWSCLIQAGDGAADANVVHFYNFHLDGIALDLSEASSGVLNTSQFNTGPGSGGPLGAQAPYQFVYDQDVTKFGGPTTAAQLVDSWLCVVQLHSDGTQKTPQQDYYTVPTDNTHLYIVPVTSWETHRKKMRDSTGALIPIQTDVRSSWAASQDPPWDTHDLAVPLWINPGLGDPATGGATYQPVTAKLASALSVEFPNGARVSHWIPSDATKGSVTENPGSTVFHVVDPSVTFTRTFVQQWRTWTASPFPHGIDAYEITKHDYFASGQDVWGWESYAWLRMQISSPGDANPILAVGYVWPEVNDSHATGTRATDYSQTEHPYTNTCHVPAIHSGSNTVDIDLLFPQEGGPRYVGRVDNLTLSGLPVGDYTLTDLQLVAKEQGYIKADYGPPIQRGDYSVLHASQDGAICQRGWPDEMQKPDEIGAHPPYGGANRYVDPITNSSTGDVNDVQYSLQDFCGHWLRQEGWSPVYSATAYNAANTDAYGTSLGPELASWLRPIAPHLRYTPGTNFLPPCGPVVRQMLICNAYPLSVYTRWPVWGAVEALIDSSGARTAPGVSVDLIRDDTGAVVATGVTDASGYVTFTPIPANGSRTYRVHDGVRSVALRPHDRIRLDSIITVVGLLGLANLETPDAKYFVAYSDPAAGIRFSRSDHTDPPFAFSVLATNQPSDREPYLYMRRLAGEHWRIILLFSRSGALYSQYTDDGGETWSNPVAWGFGGKHPAGVVAHNGEELNAGIVGTNIQGTIQYPGSTAPSAPFTFVDTSGVALQVQDDVICFAAARESMQRVMMYVRIVGDTAPSTWESSDDLRTWERIL